MIPEQGASIRLFSLLRSAIPLKAAFAGISPWYMRDAVFLIGDKKWQ